MSNFNRSNFQAHPFHLVSPSPWPLYTSISLLTLTTSAVLSFHGFDYAENNLILSIISLVLSMSLWFRDIIAEGTYMGNHTLAVQRGLNIGVGLFIVSEALFFLAIFWAFFHSALSPNVELGAMWPPMGIEAIDPFELPLLNTVILLGSGFTVTYGHHFLINGKRGKALNGLLYTIVLAVIFTALQGVEYVVSSFTISDGAFGTCFYFGTGLIYGAPIILNTNNLTKYESKLSPYWVTGFSDAESTFSVKIIKDNARFMGLRILPVFSIELHIRDIEVLKKIKQFFDVGSLTVRIRNGKPTGIYSVQSLSDLTKVIIPHFKEYVLLTQKQADFILFSSLVNLMNNKEHLNEKGINQIISIRASMNKGLTENLKAIFPNVVKAERPIIKNQIIKSPLWFIGFVDGEGCFYLKITKRRQISLSFSITQHSRDKELFYRIKNYLVCGIIEEISTRPTTINLVVSRLEDILNKIIPIFKENSLITQKYLDFHYFSKVCYLMSNKEHLTEQGYNKILLIKALKNKKEYK